MSLRFTVTHALGGIMATTNLLTIISSLLFSLLVVRGMQCPEKLSRFCSCSLDHKGGIKVHCPAGNIKLGELIPLLPKESTSLEFCVGRLESSYIEEEVTFENLTNLIHLELTWKEGLIFVTPYTIERSNLFAGLNMLQSIHIGIPIRALPSDIFLPLERLRTLDLSNTGFLNTTTFSKMYTDSHLERKPLDTLKLSRMSGVGGSMYGYFLLKEFLPVLNGSNITYIDVSENTYLYLYPGLIEFVPQLQTVLATNNTIMYKDKDPKPVTCLAIEGFLHKDVHYVDIRGLNVIGYGEDFFPIKWLLKTVVFCLFNARDCVCKAFNEYCGAYVNITNCDKVPQFDILSNILDFSCFLFVKIPFPFSLETLLVGHNKYTFAKEAFERRNVCFLPNSLRVLDCSYIPFPISVTGGNMTINGWENITELNIEYSGWGTFFHNPKFIHTMPGLRILRLSGTNIGVYIRNDSKSEIFGKAENLIELYLKNSQLIDIPAKAFSKLNKLELLSVAENKLTTISFDLQGMESLKYLDLSDNRLLKLSEDNTKVLDRIASQRHNLSVNLLGNTLSCGCNDLSFLSWIKETRVNLVQFEQYMCINHNSEKVYLKILTIKDLTIACYKYFIIMSVSVVFVLICLVLGTIVWKYRKRIYYMYLWIKYHKQLEDKINETIFVIYSDDDRSWVHEKLLKMVEEEMGHKLIIHHRDFIPGHLITDQINQFIHGSRKTIAVLSESFLDSEWCPYELIVARRLLASEGRDVIIPIILSELPDEKINHTLRGILTEKTYIKWEESLEGKRYFWKRLNLAIRIKTREKRRIRRDGYEQIPESGFKSSVQVPDSSQDPPHLRSESNLQDSG